MTAEGTSAAPAAGASVAPPAVSRVKSSQSGTTTASISQSATQTDFAYPRGHLGYLSEREETALAKFKEICQERGAWKPGPPPSHDDPTLLRFLRARRWVPEDAYKQFKDTEDWRKANDISTLYNTIDLDAYEHSRRLYPQWTGRRDRRGIPLYVFEIRNLDSKTVSNYEKQGSKGTFSDAKVDGKTPPGLLRLFALYENLTRFAQPFCTQLVDRENSDVPVTMSTNIVDISGCGLKQFWNLKNHMQAASQLATAHYPETLDRIFILGAPMFFSTVWGWIKRWFDPITVSKIFVLSAHEVKPTLEAFVDIKNIPKKYGGELDYEYGQMPTIDPGWEGVVEWEGGHKGFPSGPLLWEDIEDGKKMQCVGLGAKDGKPRREVICKVSKQFSPVVAETNGTADEKLTADDAVQTSEGTEAADAQAVTSGEALKDLKIDAENEKVKGADGVVPEAPTATTAA